MQTRIRELRESQNMSRKELAALVGVSYTVLAKWESGTNEIGLDQATAVAQALGVTLTELIGPDAPRHDARFDEIAGIYRAVSEDGKQAMLVMARGIRDGYSREPSSSGVRAS